MARGGRQRGDDDVQGIPHGGIGRQAVLATFAIVVQPFPVATFQAAWPTFGRLDRPRTTMAYPTVCADGALYYYI